MLDHCFSFRTIVTSAFSNLAGAGRAGGLKLLVGRGILQRIPYGVRPVWHAACEDPAPLPTLPYATPFFTHAALQTAFLGVVPTICTYVVVTTFGASKALRLPRLGPASITVKLLLPPGSRRAQRMHMEWGPARPGVTMQKATIRPVPTPPLVSPNFTNLNPLRHWCWGPLSIMLRGGGSLRGALHSIGAMQPRVYYEAQMFEAKKKKA